MTLPEINNGWSEGSGVLGALVAGTLVLPVPLGVPPGLGCASAVCANTAALMKIHALK
jgi:hypothetical protein